MEQNLKNHARFVTGYHRILFGLFLFGLIGSIVNLVRSVDTDNFYSASLLTLLFSCTLALFFYVRSFPLRAQDRVIRAEENFRHYILTGKTLPKELKMSQIIALRFASDDEFMTLVQRATQDNLSNKEIKSAIKSWRADHHRM